MAEVTVYDATRMKAIEDGTVVNGEIDPSTGHLMLQRFDTTEIDAGLVNVSPRIVTSATRPTGPNRFEGLLIYETDTNLFWSWDGANWMPRGEGIYICTTATRPTAPYVGMRIYEWNTDLEYMYISGAWRRHPWKVAWGVLPNGVHRLNTNSVAYSSAGNSDMVLTNMDVRNDRNYRVHLDCGVTIGGAGIWTVDVSAGGALFDRFFLVNNPYTFGEHASASCLYQPATTALTTLRVAVGEVTGTTTLTLNAGATTPRVFWIEDVGPRVP